MSHLIISLSFRREHNDFINKKEYMMKIKLNNKVKIKTVVVLVATMHVAIHPSAFGCDDDLQRPKYATTGLLESMIENTRGLFISDKETESGNDIVSQARDSYAEKLELYEQLDVKVERHFGGWANLGSYEYTVQKANNDVVSITSYYDLFSLADLISELRKGNHVEVASQLEQRIGR